MAITGTLSLAVSAKDSLTASDGRIIVNSNVGTITHRLSYSGTSNPPATDALFDVKTLSAGTLTIDLTAATSAYHATMDFTDARVHTVVVFAHSDNTANIVVKDGTTNGYNLFGDSSGQCTIAPGGIVSFVNGGTTGNPVVSASVKTIDVTSSDVDAQFDILLIAG